MTTKESEVDVVSDGGPAFPVHFATLSISPSEGMTLRDYFAAKAMQALIQSGQTIQKITPDGVLTAPARVAVPPLAYEYADAMLAARTALRNAGVKS